jgi:ferrous iron transport protein A
MAAVASTTLGFAQLRQGMRARVISIFGADEDSLRLQEMGLTRGATFRVVKVAPFGDPVEIDLRGYRLCLRKRETQGFELESLD